MKSKLVLFAFVSLIASLSYAAPCTYGVLKTIYNAQTGRPDYICAGSEINGISYIWPSTPGSPGQCLMTDGNNPVNLSWGDCTGGTPPSTAVNYALLEDTGFILLEDDSKMRLEQ